MDPELGAFISADPIGFAGGQLNLYAYASSPITLVDPSGLQPLPEAPPPKPRYPDASMGSDYDDGHQITTVPFDQRHPGPLVGLGIGPKNWTTWRDLYTWNDPLGYVQANGSATEKAVEYAALGVAVLSASAAASIGAFEFFALGNKSIIVGAGGVGQGGEFTLTCGGNTFFRLNPLGASGPGLPANHISRWPHYHRRSIFQRSNTPSPPGHPRSECVKTYVTYRGIGSIFYHTR